MQVAKAGFLLASGEECRKAGVSAERSPSGEFALPTAIIQDASGPSLRPRPTALAPWVFDAVALAHAGRNQFPSKVEFGCINGRLYAEFVTVAKVRTITVSTTALQ